jgi:hypothetical protein
LIASLAKLAVSIGSIRFAAMFGREPPSSAISCGAVSNSTQTRVEEPKTKTQEAANGIIGSEWATVIGTSDSPHVAGPGFGCY